MRDIELQQPCAPSRRATTPLFSTEDGRALTYSMLHYSLRRLLAALLGPRAAAAFSWHSIRIGLACALHASGCPDAVIQLICRWTCPESLKVYRLLGIENSVAYTDRAQTASFVATRVNNIPRLAGRDDGDDECLGAAVDGGRPAASPGPAAASPRAPAGNGARAPPPTLNYSLPAGNVVATPADPNQLVGLQVAIYDNLWPGYENQFTRTTCAVVARCLREFLHPDGARSLTYIIECAGAHYPIKHTGLLDCLTQAQRRGLPAQSGRC